MLTWRSTRSSRLRPLWLNISAGRFERRARVSVLAITFLDETYGTIVAVKHKHGVNELPLCDLKATEADAETWQLVEDYATWFANR